MNVAFKTLGWKLNYSETSSISRDFENKGYKKVSFKHNADLYVINTCSVTQNADKEFKYLVNKAKKQNPKSKIIAIGCYAQLKPNELVLVNAAAGGVGLSAVQLAKICGAKVIAAVGSEEKKELVKQYLIL